MLARFPRQSVIASQRVRPSPPKFNHPAHATSRRLFSTIPSNTGSSLKDFVPEIIYKNAGITIFLSILGGISMMIYRTSAATTNFNEVKDKLNEKRILVKSEQTDLMIQNRTFTSSTFEDICRSLPSAFPTNEASYAEFVSHVQGYLEAPIKGGNYLDRVILDRRATNSERLDKDDIHFYMVMLSLVLETEYLEDRAKVLFGLLKAIQNGNDSEVREDSKIDMRGLVSTIDYLYETCQIPVEKKVIKGSQEYPSQTYQEATAQDLVTEAITELKLSQQQTLTQEEFVDILLSKAVCAWGSCRPRR